MDPVVTLEPWSPWPLGFPAAAIAIAVVASIAGARRRNKPLREAGYVLVGDPRGRGVSRDVRGA